MPVLPEMILVDTNVVIHRQDDGRARGLMRAAGKAHHRAISAVTLYELRCGARVARKRQELDNVLASFFVLPFDAACADRSAYLDRVLRGRGDPIDVLDLFIAGTALAHGARLATLNVKHFRRVPGLRLVPFPG